MLDFPFGVDLQFDLFKRDTTNLNVDYNLGLQYLLEGNNYIKAFWNNRSSALLSINKAVIQVGISSYVEQQVPNASDETPRLKHSNWVASMTACN